jgi:uncharacterized protein GlcG (DUF336 family)
VRAELPHKPVLSLAIAKKAAESAEAEAARRKATVVIAVVDDGGHLILLSRLDDTQVASVEVGIGKARTAAIFAGPARYSRTRSGTAEWRHCRCRRRRRCKGEFPSCTKAVTKVNRHRRLEPS